jgi:hypothetical protein
MIRVKDQIMIRVKDQIMIRVKDQIMIRVKVQLKQKFFFKKTVLRLNRDIQRQNA